MATDGRMEGGKYIMNPEKVVQPEDSGEMCQGNYPPEAKGDCPICGVLVEKHAHYEDVEQSETLKKALKDGTLVCGEILEIKDLSGCVRCGGDHPGSIFFSPLLRAEEGESSHWAPCPANGEPLLLGKVEGILPLVGPVEFDVVPRRPKTLQDVIDFVFAHNPAGMRVSSWEFVEVESPSGTSIKFGEWVDRDDGYRVLRISPPGLEVLAKALYEEWCRGVQVFSKCFNAYPWAEYKERAWEEWELGNRPRIEGFYERAREILGGASGAGGGDRLEQGCDG